MDEKLQQELTTWLAGIRGAAGKASDLVLDQAPQVVHDFITLGRVENTAYLVLSVLMFVAVITMDRRLVRRYTGEDGKKLLDREPHIVIPGFLISVILVLSGIVIFGTHIHNFLASWFAPRVYLIETIAGFLRSED